MNDTVWLVERQHKPNAPDWFEIVAVCADEEVAGEVSETPLVREDWRDDDDVRTREWRVLSEVPRGMRG